MSRFGFIGPTYTSESIVADCQSCINWYPEIVESGNGVAGAVLYPAPGLASFASIANSAQARGMFTIAGRTFVVIDAEMYELTASGQLNPLGAVANDTWPVSFTASTQQVLVASGGNCYCFTLASNAFAQVGASTFSGPVTQVGFIDGFFLAVVPSKAQFFVSSPLDATTWSGTQTKIISTFPGLVVSMICDHREAWFFGQRSTEVEYDSGNIFPFDTVPGGFLEQGCGAAFGTVQFDNSVAWIGARDDQGIAMAWRANGYSPQRVSNHAVEYAWQQYPTVADARAYSYQDAGHTFWVISFPSGNATWVYDASTGQWHQRAYWSNGQFSMHRAQCHTFNFGAHLVGDAFSGTIYKMSTNYYTDFGNPIRRLRRAPAISIEDERIFFEQLEILMETGMGPIPALLDGNGNARGPVLSMRFSNDFGKTWSAYFDRDCGQAGEFRKRVFWNRLGQSRRRVFEITASDPVPYRLIDGFLEAETENGQDPFRKQERLVKQLGKVA